MRNPKDRVAFNCKLMLCVESSLSLQDAMISLRLALSACVSALRRNASRQASSCQQPVHRLGWQQEVPALFTAKLHLWHVYFCIA